MGEWRRLGIIVILKHWMGGAPFHVHVQSIDADQDGHIYRDARCIHCDPSRFAQGITQITLRCSLIYCQGTTVTEYKSASTVYITQSASTITLPGSKTTVTQT
jgi:hypothetical protein